MPSSAPMPTAPIRPASSAWRGPERDDRGARTEPVIKFIAAALWICAVTLGAVFYSFQAASQRGEPEPPKPMLGGLDYVKTDMISVPLLRDGTIDGYFLTKLVYTVEPA